MSSMVGSRMRESLPLRAVGARPDYNPPGMRARILFVALAGADENLVRLSNGSNLAKYPSIVFKVFIDGAEAAASPVMRVLSPAWRFDVPIPEGARMISVVAMDAGDGSREDFADWADAGFIVKN